MMDRHYEGTVATRGLPEFWLEEELEIPFESKEFLRSERIRGYRGCLLDKRKKDRLIELKGEARVDLRTTLRPVEASVMTCWTDGASRNNGGKDSSRPQYGAYGILIKTNNVETELAGGGEGWTNNVSELNGPIFAIRYALEHKSEFNLTHVVIISDSQYIVRGMTEWVDGWIARGWKNNIREPTPNKKLWEELVGLSRDTGIDVRYLWVRGHNGNPENERADRLASLHLNGMLKEMGVRK
jgi:ribonuclease HI